MACTRTTKVQLFVQGVPEQLVRAHMSHLGLSMSFAILPKQADVVIVSAEAAAHLPPEVRPATIVVSNDQAIECEGALVIENGCTMCAPTRLARAIARILSIEPQLPESQSFLDGE